MTNAPAEEAARAAGPGKGLTQVPDQGTNVRARLDQTPDAGQSAAHRPARPSLLLTAIQSIPIGVCAWGAKMLLERLFAEAGAHGEPEDHVAVTFHDLGDTLGCNPLTASDLLGVLARLELVTVERRLYRGETDDRAPNLLDGGTIVRLHPERVYLLARRAAPPRDTPYRRASVSATAQHAARQRELEEELARLRGDQEERLERLERQLAEALALGVVAPPAPAAAVVASARARGSKRRRRVS